MTEFITRVCKAKNSYEVIIKTDREEHYKATQDFARQLIDHAKPMTRIQKIRSMTDVEFARTLFNFDGVFTIPFCKNRDDCGDMLDKDGTIPEDMCITCLLRWLNEPEEDPEVTPNA